LEKMRNLTVRVGEAAFREIEEIGSE